MKRQVFYSFCYKDDCWRTQIVRNIGSLEGNRPVSPSAWEEVKRKGDSAIQEWIDENMRYRSCVIVLVGEDTANRPWVQYEIKHAWKTGKGLLCIDIHHFKNEKSEEGKEGLNPLSLFYIDKDINYIGKRDYPIGNEVRLSNVCKYYKPSANNIWNIINDNIESWVEEAIKIRDSYPK